MTIGRWLYKKGSRGRILSLVVSIGFLLLIWPRPSLSQKNVIIHDGITGIHDVILQKDTVLVSTLIPGSPAEKRVSGSAIRSWPSTIRWFREQEWTEDPS